jgi:hypothetical protein
LTPPSAIATRSAAGCRLHLLLHKQQAMLVDQLPPFLHHLDRIAELSHGGVDVDPQQVWTRAPAGKAVGTAFRCRAPTARTSSPCGWGTGTFRISKAPGPVSTKALISSLAPKTGPPICGLERLVLFENSHRSYR